MPCELTPLRLPHTKYDRGVLGSRYLPRWLILSMTRGCRVSLCLLVLPMIQRGECTGISQPFDTKELTTDNTKKSITPVHNCFVMKSTTLYARSPPKDGCKVQWPKRSDNITYQDEGKSLNKTLYKFYFTCKIKKCKNGITFLFQR